MSTYIAEIIVCQNAARFSDYAVAPFSEYGYWRDGNKEFRAVELNDVLRLVQVLDSGSEATISVELIDDYDRNMLLHIADSIRPLSSRKALDQTTKSTSASDAPASLTGD